ncbi:MAG: 2-dehydro-3-deoxyphosphogluconate aldolase / (4S)-4-hydroxy-2-oxoglutarate aldolase [Solirubrobacteraceae bacterium]|jgi:Entner-Doudoroff aldolase|nr:2-dehydro-3-deoxyphosphogluconate aldolase / (4S)-4-hydroxy-2-oxoglutarate aldolase [Solirubrobacteraceae bacterium]
MTEATRDAIGRTGAVVVLRLRDHGRAVEVGHVLAEAGLGVLEVTLDHPGALDALGAMAQALGDDVVLGAGTVRDPALPEQVAAAGGRFCVSPELDVAIVAATLAAGLEPLPGTLTPTEIGSALRAGARMVKLFPAGALGPGYLRALLGPFGDLAVVPTGGIRHDEVAPWLEAGAVAVGLGSDLVGARPGPGDLEEIGRRARAVVAQVQESRAGS